jgi:hypothetical protein
LELQTYLLFCTTGWKTLSVDQKGHLSIEILRGMSLESFVGRTIVTYEEETIFTFETSTLRPCVPLTQLIVLNFCELHDSTLAKLVSGYNTRELYISSFFKK